MYSTFITLALLFVSPVFASYAINQPKLEQCQTARISWPPTKGPYNVIVVDGASPCAEPLVDLGDISTTYIDWEVNLAAGTTVQLSVADSADEEAEAWTGNITITGGADKSCLEAAVAGSTQSTPASRPSASGVATTGSTTGSTAGSAADNKPAVVEEEETNYDAVGAANAGSNRIFNDDSAAPSSRQLSQSAIGLGAVAAVVAFVL